MENKTCPICGSVTSSLYGNYRKDGLCKKHANELKLGNITFDKKNNKWVNIVENTNILEQEELDIEYQNESQVCYICGEDAPQGKQCKDCYYETLDYIENIDKNRKANELREWYYNLKNSIFRMSNYNQKQTNCNKLIALAMLCRNVHGDDALISRVYKDVEDLLKANKNKKNQEEKQQNYDEHKNEISGGVKCVDGHWVENDLEREIDDILYSLRKPHVYAKRVNEITTRTVKSDWFIPVLSDTKGIYIELWGMETEDYKRNKEEKIQLYKEEELSLIEIYRKDVMSDKALLRDNLESWINEKEKELKRKR